MNTLSKHARLSTKAAVFVLVISLVAIARAGDSTSVLDDASLKSSLENMGLEISKEFKANAEVPVYVVVEKNEKGTWPVMISLSGDKTYLFVSMHLETVPEDRKIPHEVALRMLEANDNWNHPRFVFRKEDRTVRLIESLYNRDITPALLRKVMVQMIGMASQTQDLWDLTRWPTENETPTTPKADEAVSNGK
jgi:hypothetical protein